MKKFLEIVPKVNIKNAKDLALVYTPGVGESCLKIKEDENFVDLLTNRFQNVAVFSLDYQKSLEKSILCKEKFPYLSFYPFEISDLNNLKLVVENVDSNFRLIDLSLIKHCKDLNFNTVSEVIFENDFDYSKCDFLSFEKYEESKDFTEAALNLRKGLKGVIETKISYVFQKKPVAIVSDATAVLGFGKTSSYAALPVMEGKAVLFKSLADVNAMPLVLNTSQVDQIVTIVKTLENSFAAVNLEDISAPCCFEVEKKMIEESNIAVFHDDQHGTAIVVLAGILNALKLVGKKIEEVKIAVSGAGAAACACVSLLLKAGAQNIIMSDINGIVYYGRKENDKYLNELSQKTNFENKKGNLEDAIENADVFLGLSAANVLKSEMIKKMAKNPIVFALANPVPEIMPDIAKQAGAFICASGRSDFPNQINNSLAFPGLFKGVLESNAKKIDDEMKLQCAFAISSLVSEEELSSEKIIPDALDKKVVDAVFKSIINICLN